MALAEWGIRNLLVRGPRVRCNRAAALSVAVEARQLQLSERPEPEI